MHRLQTWAPTAATYVLAAVVCAAAAFGQASQPAPSGSQDTVEELTREVERLYDLGQYARALVVAQSAVEAAERQYGPTAAAVGGALVNLALMNKVQSRYDEAEKRYQRALSIYQARGPYDAEAATALNNLANLYLAMGEFAKAEPMYKQSLAIREKVLGANHLEVATSLNNLAELYRAIGRDPEAERFLKRALTIRESSGAENKLLVADTLNNIAALYASEKRYEEAVPLSNRDLEISEAELAPDHPSVAVSLNNLGELYRALGKYAQAEPLLKRALAVREKILGPNHPDVGVTLNNLALLYQAQGHYSEAQSALERDIAISRQVHGPSHPDIAQSLRNLGYLDIRREKWASAFEDFRQSTEILSERSRHWGAAQQQNLVGRAQKESVRLATSYYGLVKAAYRLTPADTTGTLIDRTFLAVQWAQASDAAAALSQMAGRNLDDPVLAALIRESQDLANEWQDWDERRSNSVSLPPPQGPQRAEEANARMAQIESRLREISSILLRDFPKYSGFVQEDPITVSDVQNLLNDREALVLFLDTSAVQPLPEETFIWVVTKTGSRWVQSQFGTTALADKIQALRCGLDEEEWTGLTRSARCGRLLGIGQPEDTDPLPFNLGIAHELYEALFGEAKDLIEGKRLLIVPSGPLTSLPFNALVTKEPEVALPKTFAGYRNVDWLARKYAISVLPSVSSLKALREGGKPAGFGKPYIGYGNPKLAGDGKCGESEGFDACPGVEVAARPEPIVSKTAPGRAMVQGSSRRRSPDLDEVFVAEGDESVIARVRRLCPLEDSAHEIRCIAERLGPGSELRLDLAATEADIRALSESGELADYRIVHFATHGLLAGDVATMAKRQGEPALVLTPPAHPKSADDDGLLTASEVAQLKLNADWVILSACNTAGAKNLGAEALSGLARAFFYAGAHSLLVSHWPVYSDAAVRLTTRAIAEMTHDSDLGRARALQRSMLALIDDFSEEYNSHPAVWAPFVVVGEAGR